MELMDSASNITQVTPKLIEFPKHFIINTQLYEKQTLRPIPMKFFVSSINNPFILLQTSITKTIYKYNGYSKFDVIQNNNEHNIQNIIQDRNDPNIFYTIQNINLDTENRDKKNIFKYQYNDVTKQYTVLNHWDIDNAGNFYSHKGDIKILYETDEYFLLSVKTQYYDRTLPNDNIYGCISLLNKKSFAYTKVHSTSPATGGKENGGFGAYSNFVLEVNNDSVYILSNLNLCTRQIVKINISSKISTVLWTETPTSNKEVNSNFVKIGNYYYVLTAYLENTVYSYKITKISLNMINDTVNTENININLNEYVLDNSPSQDLSFSTYMAYTLRLIQTNSENYISLLIHTFPNMDETWNYQSKHVLLKMNNDSFDVVDLLQLKDGCYGSLENGNSKHQIWYTRNCIMFCVFDETKEKIVCTYKKPGAFMQIGFDSLNRFITQTNDNVIEILTESNACTLQADFDKELYDKDNSSDIETTVSFYAKNFLDKYLEVDVKLTLIGPVIFKENKLKEISLSTSKTGIKNIPVIITGCGNIQVIITQNT